MMPLIVVLSYFVLTAIFRVTSDRGSRLDQIVCYGALTCFVIVSLIGARDMVRDRQAAAAERQQWKKACKAVELTIVDRHAGSTWWDDYDNRYHTISSRLVLETNPDQRAVSPNLTKVSVNVSDSLYKRLEGRNSVRIYYLPESPMSFLLEEEL